MAKGLTRRQVDKLAALVAADEWATIHGQAVPIDSVTPTQKDTGETPEPGHSGALHVIAHKGRLVIISGHDWYYHSLRMGRKRIRVRIAEP